MAAAKLASDKKGQDVVLMDMRKVSAECDWFVLVSASSVRTVRAIAMAIEDGLAEKGIKASRVEGRHGQSWVLLDYDSVVVHVFYKDIRDFYGLERLWSDAPTVRIDDKCSKKKSRKRSRKSS